MISVVRPPYKQQRGAPKKSEERQGQKLSQKRQKQVISPQNEAAENKDLPNIFAGYHLLKARATKGTLGPYPATRQWPLRAYDVATFVCFVRGGP